MSHLPSVSGLSPRSQHARHLPYCNSEWMWNPSELIPVGRIGHPESRWNAQRPMIAQGFRRCLPHVPQPARHSALSACGTA